MVGWDLVGWSAIVVGGSLDRGRQRAGWAGRLGKWRIDVAVGVAEWVVKRRDAVARLIIKGVRSLAGQRWRQMVGGLAVDKNAVGWPHQQSGQTADFPAEQSGTL